MVKTKVKHQADVWQPMCICPSITLLWRNDAASRPLRDGFVTQQGRQAKSTPFSKTTTAVRGHY